MPMRLSLLVVSRTPTLLSRMLTSVSASTELPYEEVEILCSWNGNAEDENVSTTNPDTNSQLLNAMLITSPVT